MPATLCLAANFPACGALIGALGGTEDQPVGLDRRLTDLKSALPAIQMQPSALSIWTSFLMPPCRRRHRYGGNGRPLGRLAKGSQLGWVAQGLGLQGREGQAGAAVHSALPEMRGAPFACASACTHT